MSLHIIWEVSRIVMLSCKGDVDSSEVEESVNILRQWLLRCKVAKYLMIENQ